MSWKNAAAPIKQDQPLLRAARATQQNITPTRQQQTLLRFMQQQPQQQQRQQQPPNPGPIIVGNQIRYSI